MGNFNSIIFPRPNPPSYNKNHTNLIYIPRKADYQPNNPQNAQNNTTSSFSFKSTPVKAPPVPCMFLPSKNPSDKIIIYFHGNAEDVGFSEYFFQPLTQIWSSHVIVVEYPTYGTYTNHPLSEENMKQDAEDVYDFLRLKMGLNPQQILIFGRSMGSGPACHLAANRAVGGLILFSAYKSVKEAAKSLVGGFFGGFVRDRFRNIDVITKIACPTIFIHGEKDKVIPCQHTKELFERSTQLPWRYLLTPSQMTHNEFRLEEDLIDPVLMFMEKNGLSGRRLGPFVQIDKFFMLRGQDNIHTIGGYGAPVAGQGFNG